MSEWITDRMPTEADCSHFGEVWFMLDGCKEVLRGHWSEVRSNNPWQPVICPDPYVKPKTWTVEWNDVLTDWCLYENGYHRVMLQLYNPEYREAAQKIADIYNEVKP